MIWVARTVISLSMWRDLVRLRKKRSEKIHSMIWVTTAVQSVKSLTALKPQRVCVCVRTVISSYLCWISFGSVISVAPRQFAVKSEFPFGQEINKTISALEKPLHFIWEREGQMRMFPPSDWALLLTAHY